MSRKRYNKPTNPEVEKEYKDMDLVNETNEEEVIEEKDTETFLKDVEKAAANPNNKQIDIELTVDAFIRKEPDNGAKILSVSKLLPEDKKYVPESLPGYGLAYIKKGTIVHCYEMDNGWYRLPSGYIFNAEVKRDPNTNRLINISGSNGLSRIEDVKKNF